MLDIWSYSACPMFTTRWLIYLAGAGLAPSGIIDLARPHTPVINVQNRSQAAATSEIKTMKYRTTGESK